MTDRTCREASTGTGLLVAPAISRADRLAHEASSYVRTTPAVQRAVTVFEVAAERYQELTNLDRDMTGAEFESLKLAQERMNESRAVLAAASQLHLIEVAR